MIELPRTRNGRALLVFLFLLACYGYFFPTLNNWGSNSRMDLIYALGDKGKVRIDDYHQNTGDKAYFDGHYYMEKSIGPSLLGLPFYVIFKGLVRIPPLARLASGNRGPGALPTLEEVYKKYHLPVPGTPGAGHPPLYHAMALVFVTFFSVAVTSAMLGAAVFLLADRFSAAPGNAVALALAFGLGTPAFAYSNQLYQHQAGAFGAFVGFFVLWRVMEEGASKRWLWLVGALFGYAAASEYVLAPILTLLVVWAVLRLRPVVTCCASPEELPPGSSRPPSTTWPHSGPLSQSDIGIRLFPARSNPDCLASVLRPGSPYMGSRSALIGACSSSRPSCYLRRPASTPCSAATLGRASWRWYCSSYRWPSSSTTPPTGTGPGQIRSVLGTSCRCFHSCPCRSSSC